MTSEIHAAACRRNFDLSREPRPMKCRVCGETFMGASYAKYCGRDCYNTIRRQRRRDARIEYVTLEGRPRVPRNLPIPAEWVVERDLDETERMIYELTGPSPCFYCCHAKGCRELVRRLDETNPPCFEGDE